MPIIKITQEDINKSKPLEEGWHLFRIEKFTEEDSKDKKSKNWVFELVCLDKGSQEGRYGYGRFNSKAPGMLLSSGFVPGAYDKSVDEAIEFELSELVGKELYGKTHIETYEGKLQRRTEEFATASKPPF